MNSVIAALVFADQNFTVFEKADDCDDRRTDKATEEHEFKDLMVVDAVDMRQFYPCAKCRPLFFIGS